MIEAGLVIQMVIAAIIGALAYMVIGIIPGADETATIAPVTLAIILAGVNPMVVLSFFMAVIVAKKMSDAIPVSIAGIPGGVMSTPMIESGKTLRDHGRSDIGIRKGAAASVIGTLVAVPISLLLARFLAPFSEVISQYSNQILALGAVFLALISNAKLISLLSIIPLAIIIEGIRHLYWGIGAIPADQSISISFFLAIAMGPIILNLLELAIPGKRQEIMVDRYKDTTIRTDTDTSVQNPFKVLTKDELKSSTLASIAANFTFFLSPVGMTVFLGETFSSRIKGDEITEASARISTMSALTNACYIAGFLIPLIALGLPLSPMSLGPGNPIFNAPPVFTLDNNMHHTLSGMNMLIPIIIGAAVALLVAYPIISKFAPSITRFVYKNVSQEALLGLFTGLVVMIAFMEGGVLNIIGVVALAIFSGTLNRWGVNYGIQFMSMYAAPWLVSVLASS